MYPTSNAEDGEKDINLSKLFCERSLVGVNKFSEEPHMSGEVADGNKADDNL